MLCARIARSAVPGIGRCYFACKDGPQVENIPHDEILYLQPSEEPNFRECAQGVVHSCVLGMVPI
jgi:hypothetical protein